MFDRGRATAVGAAATARPATDDRRGAGEPAAAPGSVPWASRYGNQPTVRLAVAAPLLGRHAVRSAIAYYAAHRSTFTPAVVAELRAELDLRPGGVDGEFVQALARRQHELGEQEVDGIVPAKRLAVVVRRGLARPAALDAYHDGVAGLLPGWASLPVDGRLSALAALAAAALPVQVPRVTWTVDPDLVPRGLLRTNRGERLWQIALRADWLRGVGAVEAAEVAYHEARHAEQVWTVARLVAAEQAAAAEDPADRAAVVARQVEVPDAVAELAVGQPLPLDGADAVSARAWRASMALVAGVRGRQMRRLAALKERAAAAAAKAARAPDDETLAVAAQRAERAYQAERGGYYRTYADEVDARALETAIAAGFGTVPP